MAGCNSVVVTARAAGDRKVARVKLDKCAPTQILAGKTFEYKLTATNTGNVAVDEVTVIDALPKGFTVSSSTPKASGNIGDKTVWSLGSLAVGKSSTITVKGSAANTGTLVNYAAVTFIRNICVTTKVVKPALAIKKTAPKQVQICDPIPVKIVVTNTGSGAATNVVVTDNLPAGLVTMDNKNSLSYKVGTLAAGESRSFTATLKAQKRGTYKNTASAGADGNLSATSSTSTEVLEPVLTIDKSGPRKIYVGRNITYKIMVANKGNGPANNTVVTDTLPAGAQLVNATAGGKAAGGSITWNLGTIKAGDSRTLNVTVKGAKIGNLLNKASVKAICASQVSDQVATQVAGIPAILLEVIDLEDPIEIGATTTYVITATNQGSMAGKNITITCTLEDTQQHVPNSGATKGVVTGQTIKFAPLPSLAPKATATWKLVLKAIKVGDVRFSVQMEEDQLTRPVNETEATNQY